MMRRWVQWRLLWAILMVALLGMLSTGLVSGAQRSRVLKPKAAPAARPTLPVVTAPAQPAAPVAAPTGAEITFPESDAKVRGVVPVKVAWSDERGYVIFRVDDTFVYASTSPYMMKWDTSNLSDGPHVVSVDAFDSAAKYQGSSSIRLEVANALPMPDNGVLLSLQFGPEDVLNREVMAKGELSSLAVDQVLPPGYDVLAGSLQARITQSVMDPYYRGTAVLVRNQLKEAWLTVVATRTSLPAEHALVEISRNGLIIPETSTVRRTRLPWGEISLALPDYPVFPGDTWEAPIGTVVDLFAKRTIYVSAQHTFEGLRWYGGRECAVVTSEYRVPEETLFEAPKGETPRATSAAASDYILQLTGMMGGGMRGAGARGGMRGGARGGMQGGARGGARAGRAPGGAAGGRAGGGAAETLLSARLAKLEGKRTTYLILKSGRVLHTEDAVRGQLEFQTTGGQQRAAAPSYSLQLTGMMGGGMRGGGARGGMRGGMRGGAGGGMRGGMRGGAGGGMRGGMRGGAGGARGGARAGQGRAGTAGRTTPQPIARHIPSNVGYTFRLTTDLVSR